jgi:DNA-binding transcriptional ArsR family regulator
MRRVPRESSSGRAREYRRAWATAVAKALSHPSRFEILTRLASEGSASPSEIAAGAPESLAKLAYHVRELASAGLIRRTRTRQVRGAVEHFYELTADGRAALEAVDAVMALDPKAGKTR